MAALHVSSLEARNSLRPERVSRWQVLFLYVKLLDHYQAKSATSEIGDFKASMYGILPFGPLRPDEMTPTSSNLVEMSEFQPYIFSDPEGCLTSITRPIIRRQCGYYP